MPATASCNVEIILFIKELEPYFYFIR